MIHFASTFNPSTPVCATISRRNVMPNYGETTTNPKLVTCDRCKKTHALKVASK